MVPPVIKMPGNGRAIIKQRSKPILFYVTESNEAMQMVLCSFWDEVGPFSNNHPLYPQAHARVSIDCSVTGFTSDSVLGWFWSKDSLV
jgi:hypothetical protein